MLTLLCAICMFGAIAQTDTPAYKKYPSVPPFTLLQADSTLFTKNDLKKQPTIIMYFSPTCDHCQHQWADMVKRKEDLQQFQIVMATYQPFEEMAEFYEKEQIASYPNIHVGRDEKYFLPPFYRMQSLPYLALYDKQGNLITTFEGNVKIDKLLDAFKKKK
jgi:thioredoxin-related protein